MVALCGAVRFVYPFNWLLASKSPVNVDTPVTLKLLLIVCDPVIPKVLPLKVKLPLSSISPPVPASTTRPLVKSSTLNVFAWPPALISTKPANVDIPETKRLVGLIWLGDDTPLLPMYL